MGIDPLGSQYGVAPVLLVQLLHYQLYQLPAVSSIYVSIKGEGARLMGVLESVQVAVTQLVSLDARVGVIVCECTVVITRVAKSLGEVVHTTAGHCRVTSMS